LANIASARKRARQAEHQRRHNQARRSMMRGKLKQVTAAVAKGDRAAAEAAYAAAVPVLDRMATRGVIHKNKAARHKSRLAHQIKQLG
jgi:small subunit ribosomal protein S20